MTKQTLRVDQAKPLLTDDQLREVLDVAKRTALKHGADSYEAHEVAQLTSVKLLNKLLDEDKRVQVEAALKRGRTGWRNYVSAVARNTYRDCVRSHERRIARERLVIGVVGEPLIERPAVHRVKPQNPSGLEDYLSRLAVLDAIELLDSARQQECMKMIYLDGLSINEIAEQLELEEQTIRFHVRRAHDTLRELLAP